MAATNITLLGIDVSSSVVRPGESGIAIVASGATVNLSMDWRYSYSTWILPIEISDHGTASIKVVQCVLQFLVFSCFISAGI